MNIVKRIVRGVYYRGLGLSNRFVKSTIWYKSLFVDFEHKRYPDNVWYRNQAERNFELINLGSSGGKWAFDYDGLNVKAMNWANQPQTLHDDLRLFKNFHSILKKGGKVLIVIMPFTGLNKRTGVMDALRYLPTLFGDIAQTMPEYCAASRLYRYPILFGKPAIKAVIRRLLGREIVMRPPQGSDADQNPQSADELECDAENWMGNWARQFGIADFEAPLTLENQAGRQVRVQVMRELVDFIVERGYTPFYVIPPVAEPLARRFTTRFKELYFYEYLRQVNRKVRLLDYSNEEALEDVSLYFNSFFLNRRGRKLFTERVVRDIDL